MSSSHARSTAIVRCGTLRSLVCSGNAACVRAVRLRAECLACVASERGGVKTWVSLLGLAFAVLQEAPQREQGRPPRLRWQ